MVTGTGPSDTTAETRTRGKILIAENAAAIGIPFDQPDIRNTDTIWQLALYLQGVTVVCGSTDLITRRRGR